MVLLAAFLFIPFHNRKGSRVTRALHNKPRDRLLVLRIDPRRLDEFVVQLLDDRGVVFGVHVDDEGVDHFE